MLLLKAKLDAERPPIIKVNGKSIRRKHIIKYLGVHFESSFRITKHVEETTNKARNLLSSLARVAKAKWGLGQTSMRTLYKGLFEPVITYAAAGWSDLLNKSTKSKLIRRQRMALLQVTKAYRTTSAKALEIIAGVLPIDLLIEVRARLYKKKKNLSEESSVETIIPEAAQAWQAHWHATPKRRTTYEYSKNPKDRLASRWINPDH
jgi:hypothetical protein